MHARRRQKIADRRADAQSSVRSSVRFAARLALSGAVFGLVWGCATSEVSPQATLPLPPAYVQVPHPMGFALSDVRAIFTAQAAPKLEDLKDCDADFKKLKSLTTSQDERAQGTRELVRRDPVKYHWCFYGKILLLEDLLKAESYLDEKQKAVLDTYASLVPLARAFETEYHDSRYLRWAVKHYRGISEWVFYRKVEMTSGMTSELVEASNPFGLLKDTTAPVPVLEKYNIAPTPEPSAAAPTAPVAAAEPLAAPSPVATTADTPPVPASAVSGPEASASAKQDQRSPADVPAGQAPAAPPAADAPPPAVPSN